MTGRNKIDLRLMMLLYGAIELLLSIQRIYDDKHAF